MSTAKVKKTPKLDQLTLPGVVEKFMSDGSSADYYFLPARCKQLQDLISHKDMNAQMGEIFRATYRYGEVAHSEKLRDINKILFYANAEKRRLKKLLAEEELITSL